MSLSQKVPPGKPPGGATNGHTPTVYSGSVKSDRRFLGDFPCPICGGTDDDRRGQGSRCFGFLSADGEWAYCTREEHAGRATMNPGSQAYQHRLKGKCPCGEQHAPAEPKPRAGNFGKIVASYAYHDQAGKVVMQAIRFEPKSFRQRRPIEGGKWAWNLSGVELVLYRLPELLGADPAKPVFVVEGEKDVDALRALGLVATCNPMGAGKWRDRYSDHLRDRHVVILPDNDQAGRDHAEQVARSLQGKAASVRVVGLPDLPEKGDVSDWIVKGGTAAGLLKLVGAAGEWSPPNVVTETVSPRFTNFRETTRAEEGKAPETVRVPMDMSEISDLLSAITGGWPKRVGPMLFIEGRDGKPHWLDSPPKLFAWIDRQAKVNWTKGGAFITQERFYEDQRTHAEAFDAIETSPHFPPMPRTYYMHRAVGKPGAKLDGLIDFFSPDSETDRELIKAFILTLFWGGFPGRRPAFLFTGPDTDPENGRGVGKSTMPEIISQGLAGGFIGVSPSGDMELIKTRLLSPPAAFVRVARLDNVKTLRFSWADLEEVITNSIISGRRLYQGDGSRPNTLTWAITVNGESFSEDLAGRCVHVKIGRPTYLADWETRVRSYMEDNLAGLWGDIRHALETAKPGLKPSGRWAMWECDVLAATENPTATQWELIKRRESMNADRREAGDFRHYLVEQFAKLGHPDADLAHLFVSSQIMGAWLSTSEQKKYATNQASSRVRGFGISELAKTDTMHRRGWTWQGSKYEGNGDATEITYDQAFPPQRSYGVVGAR